MRLSLLSIRFNSAVTSVLSLRILPWTEPFLRELSLRIVERSFFCLMFAILGSSKYISLKEKLLLLGTLEAFFYSFLIPHPFNILMWWLAILT